VYPRENSVDVSCRWEFVYRPNDDGDQSIDFADNVDYAASLRFCSGACGTSRNSDLLSKLSGVTMAILHSQLARRFVLIILFQSRVAGMIFRGAPIAEIAALIISVVLHVEHTVIL